FDGDGFFELFVVALGKEDGSHAAAAEETLDDIGSEVVAGRGLPEERVGRIGILNGITRGGRLFVAAKKRFGVTAEFGIVGAGFGEPRVAAPGWEFERAFDELS
ncbi:MAG: hypothetical protein ABI972_23420, partial [Acidobacteriota bacterium]